MFLEKYFPPSMVTKLINEITNFQQCLDGSLFEAWECYKISIDRCPKHNMLPVTQIDTFYNGLTLRHRDTINSAAGGTFMKRRPEECYDLIKNMTAHHNDWDTSAQRSESSSSITSSFNPKIVALKAEMAKINKNLMRVLQVNQQVKAFTPNCETYGGPHSFNDCPATVGQTQNLYAAGAYQGANSYQPQGNRNLLSYRSDNYLRPPGNTVTNLNEELKGITTLSGTAYQGPTIPTTSSSLPKVVEHKTEQNLMPLSVWNKLSLPELTPTLLTLELANRLISRPISIAEDVYVKVGKFHFPVNFIVVDFDADPQVPLILRRSFLKIERALIDIFEGELTLRVGREAITFNLDQTSRYSANYKDMTANRIDVIDMDSETDKSSIDEPPEVELKDLPPHLEYVFLEGDDKLPVIIAKDLSDEEKTTLITVLKSHKRSIAWKLSYIKGIDPEFCTHKILMEDDFEPAVQHQRRVNLKIHGVIKNEVLKLLDAGLIYPLSDVPWVSPVHYVPKKGGFTVVKNEENELVLTRLVTGWRVCIDYRKLNEATRKEHFPLPFMDQMLERLEGKRVLLFSQWNSYQTCLSYLEKMLKQCEDTNLCLNWEKSHFMVKEGIVLGHKISKNRIEVDKAKVHVIAKLPHPITIKGICSFLGHVDFYRRFIQDFSKIAWPMTRLLEKDTPFFFYTECVEAFQTLKRKLTEAPILIAPDWDLPFELMCDASEFAIGAVLGQRQKKHFRHIHYASKTMAEAESNYTTIEKEMLVMVYAFEKFQSYLIMNKSIVYTDHFALKYLFAKKDSKARLLCWVLLLQVFTFKVIDTKGAENLAVDHLSRLENPHQNVLCWE
uniref:RNA-directed DNA polymerase n=1 Tax=Tanacetum cinerariifolium TaxID=118510 RepID=A0A699HF03_TANCI|nr:hypothetical protein [Tanacetum cinerariifolium]